jgi:DNA-binding protein HU-beta
MNKEELVKSIAEKATKETGFQVSQNIARACVNAFVSTVKEKTKKREPVALVGFGTFDTADRAARVGRNPQTKEEIQIPAKVVPVFKPGSDLKDVTANLRARKKR